MKDAKTYLRNLGNHKLIIFRASNFGSTHQCQVSCWSSFRTEHIYIHTQLKVQRYIEAYKHLNIFWFQWIKYMTPKLYSMHVAGTPSVYLSSPNTISLAWPRHSPQVANRPNAGRRQPTNDNGWDWFGGALFVPSRVEVVSCWRANSTSTSVQSRFFFPFFFV